MSYFKSDHFRNNKRLIAAASNNPPLKIGCEGQAVVRLQDALINLGYPMPNSTQADGPPDGIYGSETRSQVNHFQGHQKPKLSTDGQAGKNTLKAIDETLVDKHISYTYKPGKNCDADSFGPFRIFGGPEPQSLPVWSEWNCKSYKTVVNHQIKSKLLTTGVGRAVIRAIKGSIAIRPAPHARNGDAYFKPAFRTVFYLPGNFDPDSSIYTESRFSIGMTPDAVLLHELVHAMRFSAGFGAQDREEIPAISYPPGRPPSYKSRAYLYFGDRAEFNAIVIANTFRSALHPSMALGGMARQVLLLRKDHHSGHTHIPLVSPEKFHTHGKIKHYLKMLWREQPELCREIALVRAPFNPLRDVKKLG